MLLYNKSQWLIQVGAQGAGANTPGTSKYTNFPFNKSYNWYVVANNFPDTAASLQLTSHQYTAIMYITTVWSSILNNTSKYPHLLNPRYMYEYFWITKIVKNSGLIIILSLVRILKYSHSIMM